MMTPIDKFKRELLVRRYAQSSIDTYTSCLSVIYYKVSPDFDIQKIKDYVITLKERSYHKQMVSAIRNYYDFVLGIKLNLSDLPYPRREQKLPEVFSVQEMKRLIEYPKNLKHQIIICYLYNCGLRINELIHIKLSDINRERMVIKIRSSKGNKDREIPISPDLLKLTEDYYREYLPKEYLINGFRGEMYTESSINQLLKYWATKAGIKSKIHAHKLRHCYATHLHESGIDLNIIKNLLGHSRVSTTEIYTKVSSAYRRVPSLLNGINLK